jgi:putative transposase
VWLYHRFPLSLREVQQMMAQRGFLSAFSGISPHFRPRRHRLTAEDYRCEMDTRFTTWNEVTGTATAAA